MEHFEKTIWRWDPLGTREYKLLELRLHPPPGDALPDPRCEKMRDWSSFWSALYELSDCPTIDEWWYQEKDTWDYHGDGDGNVSISSGSLSPDLGEIWLSDMPLTGTVTSTLGPKVRS